MVFMDKNFIVYKVKLEEIVYKDLNKVLKKPVQ